MGRYRLTPRARLGFENVILYVERELGSLVATEVLDRLEGAFEHIAENPGIGHARADITRIRVSNSGQVGPTLIAYRSASEVVEILFVERAARDWVRLLRAES